MFPRSPSKREPLEILVWVHVPEYDQGKVDWDTAVKLANERFEAKQALKLANVAKAAAICTEALGAVPDREQQILEELGFLRPMPTE